MSNGNHDTMKKSRGPSAVSATQRNAAATIMQTRPDIGPSALAKETGISVNTAKAWLKKHRAALVPVDPAGRTEPVRINEVIDDLQRSAAAGSEIVRRYMEESLKKLLDAIANGEGVPATTIREIKGLADTMSSLVSQMKSLQGEPTSISTVLDASPDQLDLLLLEHIQQACDTDKSLRGRILEMLGAPKAIPKAAKQTDPRLTECDDEDEELLLLGDGQDGHPGDFNDGYPDTLEQRSRTD